VVRDAKTAKIIEESIDEIATKEHQDASNDKEVGDDLADKRGRARRPPQAARDFPDDRTQDAATIQGEAWNQVEDTEHQVDSR
jgi:hypothetical protein